MTDQAQKWQDFWAQQDSNLNRYQEEHHVQDSAEEFRDFYDLSQSPVLEIGCGEGMLTEKLGFLDLDYQGVDFAVKLIDQFKANHPDVKIEVGDGSRFLTDRKFSTVFSSGVLQNFDATMLDRFFANTSKMLASDGQIICGNVPDAACKFRYSSGLWLGTFNLKGAISHFLRPSSMIWWNRGQFEELAKTHGLAAEFITGRQLSYRFHCRLTHMQA